MIEYGKIIPLVGRAKDDVKVVSKRYVFKVPQPKEQEESEEKTP